MNFAPSPFPCTVVGQAESLEVRQIDWDVPRTFDLGGIVPAYEVASHTEDTSQEVHQMMVLENYGPENYDLDDQVGGRVERDRDQDQDRIFGLMKAYQKELAGA